MLRWDDEEGSRDHLPPPSRWTASDRGLPPSQYAARAALPDKDFLSLPRDSDTLDQNNAGPSATQPPAPPPNKALKRTRQDTPRDQSHDERLSPHKRYTGKNKQRASSPTPSRSLVSRSYDPEEEWSPIDDHPFFEPAAPTETDLDIPPHPSAASSPSASASSPRPATTQSPPPSPSVSAQSRPASPSLTATPLHEETMEDDTPPVRVFKAPTRSEFLVMEPTCTDENPHCPSTAHNANSEKALTQYTGFQANDASWGTPIIPDHVVLEHLDDATQASVRANPEQYLALTPFCAGSTFYAKYKNARVDAVAVLEEVAGAGKVTVIMPQVKLVATKQAPRRKPGGKPDKFAGHISLLIRCSDLDIRTAFLDPATYAADQLLAFHITPFDATVLSWAVGFFKTDISDTSAATARRFRWAVYDKLTNSSPAPKAAALIDRATQGGNVLPREERVLNFAKTIQVRYLPHDTDPVYVLHAKPCTKDPKLWDEIRAALRITYTDLLEAFVPHANAATGHNLCANCKLDCHPRYNCMFTERDRGWWGPKSLEGIIRQINGGNSDSEGENRGEPRPRTGGPFVARGRGRGRR
ncbi:hypothetical protein B0H15DRAFT_943817 [Mycena belliarum]|uniref:Uncharacterized protein n=1 Tax=Mycena belliarum TaxID=1033014 RepID=A0AAD6UMD7_9AGAR|nr:hypothetical protein B0H15DRAFT_943817 [Mycena belliae]